MGSGTTVSLKQPYSITLKTRNWTDIALPFKFNVKIGDIINETSKAGDVRGKIAIYRWVTNDSDNVAYTTQKHLDIGGMDSSAYPLTYSAADGEVGTYAFYNSSDEDIVLKIPPIPDVFSEVTPASGTGKRRYEDEWTIAVKARTGDGIITPVYFGYRAGSAEKRFPVAPTFSRQRLHIIDHEDNTILGNILFNAPKNGGFVVPLRFENMEDKKVGFDFEIQEVVSIPEDFRVGVYNPETGAINEDLKKQKVDVKARSRQSRWVLVGDTSFIAGWYRKAAVSFSLVRIFPNPCRGELSIRFTLPYGNNKNVKISVFDQLGRCVWNKSVSHSLKGGMNNIKWNPRSLRFPVGAGTYLVRVSAFEDSGKSIGTKVQRILYIP
jgi:hypothetical protein